MEITLGRDATRLTTIVSRVNGMHIPFQTSTDGIEDRYKNPENSVFISEIRSRGTPAAKPKDDFSL